MIKLYKGIVPYEECKCYVHAEATQEDIDQWNLERGGGSIYFVINRHGLPDKTAITKLVSIHTHTAVMSAPQEIVVEKTDDGSVSWEAVKDLKLDSRAKLKIQVAINRALKAHREGEQS